MIKIGIIDTINKKGIDLLKANKNNFSYEIIKNLSKKNLIKELPKFDGITLRRGAINSKVLKNCKKLKVISRHGVGYDNVDIAYLKKKGIKLLVANDSTCISPSEHIMFMILSIFKGRNIFHNMVRKGSFHKAIHMKFNNNFELYGKTILIVGFGRIGRKLIKQCKGFGMKVLVYDPFIDKKIINSYGGKKISIFNLGIQIADIVSLCIPLNKKTKNLITYKELSIMKKSSILINISRGGLINEHDLNKALNKKIISFAGLDVFSQEPPNIKNPLLKNKKVFLSPHAATFTKEGLEKMSVETVRNIIDFFNKKIDKRKIVKL